MNDRGFPNDLSTIGIFTLLITTNPHQVATSFRYRYIYRRILLGPYIPIGLLGCQPLLSAVGAMPDSNNSVSPNPVGVHEDNVSTRSILPLDDIRSNFVALIHDVCLSAASVPLQGILKFVELPGIEPGSATLQSHFLPRAWLVILLLTNMKS